MAYQMDLADKGLLMYLMGIYKWIVENQLKHPIPWIDHSKDIPRLKLELERIERASEIIHDIP